MKGVSLRFLLKPGVSSLKHVTKFVEEGRTKKNTISQLYNIQINLWSFKAIPVNINKAIVFNTVKAFDLIIGTFRSDFNNVLINDTEILYLC